jgi:hypothetical protein
LIFFFLTVTLNDLHERNVLSLKLVQIFDFGTETFSSICICYSNIVTYKLRFYIVG